MLSDAVVATNEHCLVRYSSIDISANWRLRADAVFAPFFVRLVAIWMVVVIYGQHAVFYCNSLSRKCNNALNDIFVCHTRYISRVLEDDNFTAFWHIGFVGKLGLGDRYSVDN